MKFEREQYQLFLQHIMKYKRELQYEKEEYDIRL